MGVLTDLVIADRRDAQRVCDSEVPSRDFHGRDIKGIDTVKLGMLYAILTNQQFDPGFGSEILASGSDDGPWVFEVPSQLVSQLASLNEVEISPLALKWAAIEEFSSKYSKWQKEDVLAVLNDIVTLCRNAHVEKKSVLMWMCL